MGREINMEISFSLDMLLPGIARRIISGHPDHRILFGSDSPWTDQSETLAKLKALQLGAKTERLVLRDNARALLGITTTAPTEA